MIDAPLLDLVTAIAQIGFCAAVTAFLLWERFIRAKLDDRKHEANIEAIGKLTAEIMLLNVLLQAQIGIHPASHPVP